jgi:hypothetical protein
MAFHTSTRAGGRPPKFDEPSGPVTVTLPARTLRQLQHLDLDRARAIVKAVNAAVGDDRQAPPRPDIVEMAPGTGLLVLPPMRSLQAIPWLTLIEVTPTRYLITIESGTPIEKVELTLMDLIEQARATAPDEVPLLEMLRERIGELRRGARISTAEVLFVATKGRAASTRDR